MRARTGVGAFSLTFGAPIRGSMRRSILSSRWLLVGSFAALAACASAPDAPNQDLPPAAIDSEATMTDVDAEIYRRAEAERGQSLEAEVKRLRAALQDAEAAVVAMESGLAGQKTRADAVSETAAARVQVERARRAAAWRVTTLDEATKKLSEAERQIEGGSFGAAIFFASRAVHLATQVLEEAERTASASGVLHVTGRRVNLRQGPSTDREVVAVLESGMPVITERREAGWVLVRTGDGRVGWIHERLVE